MEGTARESLLVSRIASQPSVDAPAEHVTGQVRVQPYFEPEEPSRTAGAAVIFEPSARSNWHTHELAQTLIVTAGTGRVQKWGGPVQEIREGDVIHIPPGTKHWHGAGPNSPMTHISVVERPGSGSGTTWLEPVSDEQYAAMPATSGDEDVDGEQPTRAQQLMGDVAPKLAELTDDVLYGQVWADRRSPRDRPGTVGPDRYERAATRSHLGLARRNGVSEEELVAAITHLAFYSGWPNSVTAVSIAREVFDGEQVAGESR
jgi:4-carboxymuconolactone decarboxylase